jgi:hypothetical protein
MRPRNTSPVVPSIDRSSPSRSVSSLPVDAQGASLVVDAQRLAAGDAHLAHLAGDERRVAGHAAARGEDALRRDHAADVLRRRLDAHEDHRFAARLGRFGVLGVEVDTSRRGAGAGVEPLGEAPVILHGARLLRRGERRAQQLVELLGIDAQERVLPADQLLAHHLDGDADGGVAGPLSDAALQHVERALLDGELDVHHVAVVALEGAADGEQLGVDRGVVALELADRQRRAGTGDDVLALRVHQVLAVEEVLAGRGIAGEGDAGPGVLAEVAEDHRLHVDGGAPRLGDAVQLAVEVRAIVVPRAEHGADGAPELGVRILGELDAAPLADGRLELGDQLAQVVGGELGVELDAARVLLGLEQLLERIDLVLVLRLEAEHDVAVHLHEAAIGVVGEARIAGERDDAATVSSLRPRLRIVSIMPGIEARAPERTDTKSGLVGVAEAFADQAFDVPQLALDLGAQRRGYWRPWA